MVIKKGATHTSRLAQLVEHGANTLRLQVPSSKMDLLHRCIRQGHRFEPCAGKSLFLLAPTAQCPPSLLLQEGPLEKGGSGWCSMIICSVEGRR